MAATAPNATIAMTRLIAIFTFAIIVLGTVATASDAASTGSASWYALDGRTTASGERMNSARMTAAHRKFLFGTKLRVTNLHNRRSVVVRVNDRGPYAKGRILDVSKAAAAKLGFIARGHTKVSITRVANATPVGEQPRWPQLAKLVRVATPRKRPAAFATGLVQSGER